MSAITKEMKLENSLSKLEKKKIIILLCAVLLFSVMNGTMFMIAVPDIASYFSLLPSQVSWVVTGYMIIYAIGALMYGKLADIYPFKLLLTFGLSLFAIGSLTGFFSLNYNMVIIARMIQAAGAASVPALAFIAPSRYFPDEKGKVLGIASSTMAFAAGIGPIIGGFIAGTFSWKYLFLISAFVVITIPFFRIWLPEEVKKGGKSTFSEHFYWGWGWLHLFCLLPRFNCGFLLLVLSFSVYLYGGFLNRMSLLSTRVYL